MTLRDLWLGHIFWVRNVSVAAIDKNDPAIKAAEKQAVANAQAIAASIEPFYGAPAKDKFFKLLAGHYGAVKAYLVAAVAGDVSAQAKATQSLASNADEIATFLSLSESLFAERRSARPSSGAWRPSHSTNPAIKRSQLRR